MDYCKGKQTTRAYDKRCAFHILYTRAVGSRMLDVAWTGKQVAVISFSCIYFVHLSKSAF